MGPFINICMVPVIILQIFFLAMLAREAGEIRHGRCICIILFLSCTVDIILFFTGAPDVYRLSALPVSIIVLIDVIILSFRQKEDEETDVYHLEIRNGHGKHKIYRKRKYLYRNGFSHKSGSIWELEGTQTELKKWIRFAKRHRYRYELTDGKFVRNKNYRKEWLKENPAFYGWYLCAYCGRPVRAGRITVDHIIPVNKVKKEVRYQKMLKAHGANTVNDTSNLCGACESCNRAKSDHGGLWIWKGFIFRHRCFRIMRLILCCTAIVLVCGFIWKNRYVLRL